MPLARSRIDAETTASRVISVSWVFAVIFPDPAYSLSPASPYSRWIAAIDNPSIGAPSASPIAPPSRNPVILSGSG